MPTFAGVVPQMVRDPYFRTLDGWSFNRVNDSPTFTTWSVTDSADFMENMLILNRGDTSSAPLGIYVYTDLINSWSVGDTLNVTGEIGCTSSGVNVNVSLIALDAAGATISTIQTNTQGYVTSMTAFSFTSSAIPAGTVTVRLAISRTNASAHFNLKFKKMKVKKANNLSTYRPNTLAVCKLEIEPYPSSTTNKLDNAYVRKGGYQWVTTTNAGSFIDRASNKWVYHASANGNENSWTTEPMTCQPGNWITGRFNGQSTTGHYRTRIEFLTNAPTSINQDGDIGSGLGVTAGAWNTDVQTIAAAQAPSTTALFRLRIEMGSAAGAYPYAAGSFGNTLTWDNVQLFESTTSAVPASLTAIQWIDLMTSSSDVIITRDALNLGSLTATILDKTLDPLEATHIRPNRRLNCLVFNSVTDQFEPAFSGEVDIASVSYDATLLMTAPNARETAKITLNAVDGQRKLSGAKRPFGVALVTKLPWVLEGCRIEWDCDGNRDQVGFHIPISRNDSSSALDQVILTRDSVAGYAWVDRWNRLIAKTKPFDNKYPDYSYEVLNTVSSVVLSGSGAFARAKVPDASTGGWVLQATGLLDFSNINISSPSGTFAANDPGSLRFKMRRRNAGGTVAVEVRAMNGGTDLGVRTATRIVTPALSTDWQEYVLEGFTMPAGTSTHIKLKITCNATGTWGSGGIIEIDDVIMVKKSTLASVIFDNPTYSHIEPAFDTFGFINEITFKALTTYDDLQVVPQNSDEITIGPFQHADSIAEWGRYSKEIRVHNFGNDPAPGGTAVTALANLVNDIFGRNAYPKVRVDQITVPVTDLASLKYASLDIYDYANVINNEKKVNEYSAITGIRHGINTARWDIDFVFDDIESSVAGSLSTPSPSNDSINTDWITPTLAGAWTHFDGSRTLQYRKLGGVIHWRGLVKDGSGLITTMPVGYRPASRALNDQHYAVAANSAFGMVAVNGDGTVVYLVGSNSWVDFSNITYIVEG